MAEMQREKNPIQIGWIAYGDVNELSGVFMISVWSYGNDRLHGSIQFKSRYLWLHYIVCQCTLYVFIFIIFLYTQLFSLTSFN